MVEARGCSLWLFPVGALAKVRLSGAGSVFLLDSGPDWAAGRYVQIGPAAINSSAPPLMYNI